MSLLGELKPAMIESSPSRMNTIPMVMLMASRLTHGSMKPKNPTTVSTMANIRVTHQ